MKKSPVAILLFSLWLGCAGLPRFASEPELLRALQTPPLSPALGGAGGFQIIGPEGIAALRFAFLLAAPDRIRLEALSPLGSLAFLLVQNGAELKMFIPPQKLWVEGGEARELLGDYLPGEITPEGLIFFLHGVVPESFWRGERPEVSVGRRSWRLSLTREEGRVQAEYSARLRLKKLELYDREGKLSSRASFRDYQSRKGFPVPTRIEFFLPRPEGNTRVWISLSEVETEPVLAPDSFQLFPPRD